MEKGATIIVIVIELSLLIGIVLLTLTFWGYNFNKLEEKILYCNIKIILFTSISFYPSLLLEIFKIKISNSTIENNLLLLWF